MNRLQNIEDATEIVVGKYYLVPTVFVPTLPKGLQIVPVIGPAHEDAEFIKFPHRHMHPDRRFVSVKWLDYYGRGVYGDKAHWAVVYSFTFKTLLEGIERDTGVREAARERMRCKRMVTAFRKDAPWLARLESAYRDERLRDGHICPHRGISCRGVAPESDGVVCPGHGLKWNMETGALVSRTDGQFRLPLGKDGRIR